MSTMESPHLDHTKGLSAVSNQMVTPDFRSLFLRNTFFGRWELAPIGSSSCPESLSRQLIHLCHTNTTVIGNRPTAYDKSPGCQIEPNEQFAHALHVSLRLREFRLSLYCSKHKMLAVSKMAVWPLLAKKRFPSPSIVCEEYNYFSSQDLDFQQEHLRCPAYHVFIESIEGQLSVRVEITKPRLFKS